MDEAVDFLRCDAFAHVVSPDRVVVERMAPCHPLSQYNIRQFLENANGKMRFFPELIQSNAVLMWQDAPTSRSGQDSYHQFLLLSISATIFLYASSNFALSLFVFGFQPVAIAIHFSARRCRTDSYVYRSHVRFR